MCKETKQYKKYWQMILLGLAAGIITRLSDLCPYDDLWSFSSIATLFGFWIVTNSLIIWFASSNRNAGIMVFLYMFFMDISFYGLEYILGFFFQRFDNGGFRTGLFLIYGVGAIICGIMAYVLYFWNRKGWYSSVFLAGTVGVLLAETVGVTRYLLTQNTFLFQLLFDAVGVICLGVLFGRKAQNKVVFTGCVAVFTVVFYLFLYRY